MRVQCIAIATDIVDKAQQNEVSRSYTINISKVGVVDPVVSAIKVSTCSTDENSSSTCNIVFGHILRASAQLYQNM